LMEKYAKEVKDNSKFLAQWPRGQHPVQAQFAKAEYVGSAECASCHKHAYKVWKDTKHAKALTTLTQAKNPSLRDFDPECIRCHTVGFEYNTGYYDPPKDGDLTEHNLGLRDVGCESCHGPGSAHIKKPKDKDIHKAMNPFGANNIPAGAPPAAWNRRR